MFDNLALGTLRDRFGPYDRRSIYDWAREHVSLPSCYAIQGMFHVEQSRYLMEPLNAILDDRVREVTIVKGVQTGGSLIGDLTVCHTICNRPMNIFHNFPTDEQADHYGERRLMPLLENCEPIRKHLKHLHRHKKKKNEIILDTMWLALQGANVTNLQTHSVPMLINEELWEWEQGMYLHACARTTYFQWRSKIINISQAGTVDEDLDRAYKAGSQEEWEVPCPVCHQYQPLNWNTKIGDNEWAGMTWDTNEQTKPGGEWNFDAVKLTARFKCRHCLAEIHDTPANRRYLNDHGQYRVSNPNAPSDKRSFWWPSLACDQVSFGLLVEEYLRAKEQARMGNRLPLREFYQKRQAVPYDAEKHDTVEKLEIIALESKPEPGKPWVHGEITFEHLLSAVDVQRDHFWMLVEAWSQSGDSITLWAGKLTSWTEIREKQLEYGILDQMLAVDCAHRQNEVFRECTRHGHYQETAGGKVWLCWKALRGADTDSFPYRPQRGQDRGRTISLPYSWPPSSGDPCFGLRSDDPLRQEFQGRFCPVISWSNPTIKDIAAARRDGHIQGSKNMIGPGEWNEEFGRQMFAERKVKVTNTLGQTKWRWEKFRANHLWDCKCMIIARAMMLQIPVGGSAKG